MPELSQRWSSELAQERSLGRVQKCERRSGVRSILDISTLTKRPRKRERRTLLEADFQSVRRDGRDKERCTGEHCSFSERMRVTSDSKKAVVNGIADVARGDI